MSDYKIKDFFSWHKYWGLLFEDHCKKMPSAVHGFENISSVNSARTDETVALKKQGALYGFVQEGSLIVKDSNVEWRLKAGQWFTLPNGGAITIGSVSRVVVIQRLGYFGISAMGGPIEPRGRLRYIDGCSDTLLCAPPLLGDPCLNFLHFPEGITQTTHTHPSTRAGIVSGGSGWCVTPNGKYPLTPGCLFYIPAHGLHRFQTDNTANLNVIAYHPDSDWGPTHENHPMLNRTWVDGAKIENSTSAHQPKALITSNTTTGATIS